MNSMEAGTGPHLSLSGPTVQGSAELWMFVTRIGRVVFAEKGNWKGGGQKGVSGLGMGWEHTGFGTF